MQCKILQQKLRSHLTSFRTIVTIKNCNNTNCDFPNSCGTCTNINSLLEPNSELFNYLLLIKTKHLEHFIKNFISSRRINQCDLIKKRRKRQSLIMHNWPQHSNNRKSLARANRKSVMVLKFKKKRRCN